MFEKLKSIIRNAIRKKKFMRRLRLVGAAYYRSLEKNQKSVEEWEDIFRLKAQLIAKDVMDILYGVNRIMEARISENGENKTT